jgi:hypothetical protein
MLPSLSRKLRLALVFSAGVAAVAWHGHTQSAYADDDDEDSEDGGDGDKGDDGDEGDEGDEDDKDQPPVTAGGMFTKKTFPVRELDRPLTITQGITQLRLGLGTDVSDKGAFESFGVNLEGLYGYKDNVMLVGGFTSAYNMKDFGVYAGLEGALAYDLIDFRTALRISRPAAPDLTTPGKYVAGKTHVSVDLGFPFRYVAKPEIAIIALNTLMSIDFDGKPDLNPSLGVATNPIAPVSVVVFAQLQIIDFDTTAGFTVPATARVEFSPSQSLDLGMEFKFLNVKPVEGTKFYDNRFLTLFAQARF